MKKTAIALLLITMLFTLSLSAACVKNKLGTATAIEVVSPVTTYVKDSTIDYDSLEVKVTYDSGETQTDTVKNLGATVSAEADLSQAGTSSYTITYEELTYTVEITVVEASLSAIQLPEFYLDYLTASADRSEDEEETRADFRITGEAYEVGNVNKLIFRPLGYAFDSDYNRISIDNVATVATVYQYIDDEWKLVPDTDLESLVTIDDNTYKFSADAAGMTFKIVLTPDSEVYDLSGITEEDRTISFECTIVDGGYNVYDQQGLSVMNDLTSKAWASVWGCTVTYDGNNGYTLTANDDALTLEADDKPLCEYVGKVDWVILHASFAIDADLLPSEFFWWESDTVYGDKATTGYSTVYDALTGIEEAQAELNGSLYDGANGSWYRIINSEDGGASFPQLGFSVNMQKGIYSTSKVSVSGNYNSITAGDATTDQGRKLYMVYNGSDTSLNIRTPSPHWTLFQMCESKLDGAKKGFTMKNISMTGNSAQIGESGDDDDTFVPGGLQMLNSYAAEVAGDETSGVHVTNVNANSFYTITTMDSYGTTKFDIDSVKYYNAFSNMFYGWRAHITVTNSELIGCGGPLFILCDGDNAVEAGTITTDDSKGCTLTVDDASVLEAYATGTETWYSLYNAQSIFNMIKTLDGSFFNNVYKTIQYVKDSSGNAVAYGTSSTAENTYCNLIALMCSEPSNLFTGLSDSKIHARGLYTSVDADGNTTNNFALNNSCLSTLRYSQGDDGTKLPLIVQLGDNYMWTDLSTVYSYTAANPMGTFDETAAYGWATATNDKVAIYLSAGSTTKSSNAPYFGVVLGISALGA